MALYIIIAIFMFGVLIAVHEGGHFVAAKKLDVRVNEFSIGMGPALFSREKGETKYSLRLFPVGGYCAMEGEDQDTGDPRAFSSKAPWRRVIILAAGSVTNFVAGFLILVFLFLSAGSYVVPVIDDFMEGFPTGQADSLQEGDRILSIDGKRVLVYADVSAYLSASDAATRELVVVRDGERVTLHNCPIALRDYVVDGQTVQRYGLYFGAEDVNPLGLLRQSWNTSWYFCRAVWSGLGMLVTGQVSLNDMSGPVGIVSFVGEAGTEADSTGGALQNIFYIIALIAVNLAVMNLLPIPALDGGRIFFLLASELIYFVTRRRVDPKYEAWLHAAGFVLLMVLMVVITFNDVVKLVK